VDPKVAQLTRPLLEQEIREYRALLDAKAPEAAVHGFLAERSYFFNGELRLSTGASPLYSKIRLGSEYELDFAWFDTGSSGAEWRFVELEAPSRQMFRKSGEPSYWLNHALQQVRDWNSWVHQNLAYARKLMPYVDYPLSYVVVGRRKELTSTNAERLKRLCYENRQFAAIHTLDWIAELATSAQALISPEGGTWGIPARAYSDVDLRQKRPSGAFAWLGGPFQTMVAKRGLRERIKEREDGDVYNEEVRAILGPHIDWEEFPRDDTQWWSGNESAG
jgi:hypothetical protein